MKNVWTFVLKAVPTLESLSDSKAYQLMDKLNKGEKLTRGEKDWVVESTLFHHGYYRLFGWEFCFARYMRRFVVHQYDSWACYRAFDKTSLRKALGAGVKEIHEIKSNEA